MQSVGSRPTARSAKGVPVGRPNPLEAGLSFGVQRRALHPTGHWPSPRADPSCRMPNLRVKTLVSVEEIDFLSNRPQAALVETFCQSPGGRIRRFRADGYDPGGTR